MRLFLKLVLVVVGMLELLFLNSFPLILHLSNLTFLAFGSFILLKKAHLVKQFFKLIIVLLYAILAVAKFSLIDQTQAVPLVYYYELGITCFLILLFGIKRVYGALLYVLISNYLRIYMILYVGFFNHWISIENTHASLLIELFFATAGMLAMFLYAIKQFLEKNTELKTANNQLSNELSELEAYTRRLQNMKDRILDISERNSHQIRNPITRIKSVDEFLKHKKVNQELNDAYQQEFFKMTTIYSVHEFKKQLAELKDIREALKKDEL